MAPAALRDALCTKRIMVHPGSKKGGGGSPSYAAAAAASAAAKASTPASRASARALAAAASTPGGVITTDLSREQAVERRDALAKALYAALFDWLVGRLNRTIAPEAGDDAAGSSSSSSSSPSPSFGSIGLLDIYGFEVFNVNSFEQLCINYANEKLQQHFNRQIFKQEQEIYLKEAIKFLTKNGLDVPDELTDNAIDFFIAKRQLIKEAYLEAATQDGASYNAEAEVFDTMFQDLQGIKQSLT